MEKGGSKTIKRNIFKSKQKNILSYLLQDKTFILIARAFFVFGYTFELAVVHMCKGALILTKPLAMHLSWQLFIFAATCEACCCSKL